MVGDRLPKQGFQPLLQIAPKNRAKFNIVRDSWSGAILAK